MNGSGFARLCRLGGHQGSQIIRVTMSPKRSGFAWPRRWRNETMDGSETNWLQYWRPVRSVSVSGYLLYLTFFGALAVGQLSSPSSAS